VIETARNIKIMKICNIGIVIGGHFRVNIGKEMVDRTGLVSCAVGCTVSRRINK
jgi:hypothetical protein